MELSQIKYFLNLAETLNFTEAARQSGISQPSLTRSIQRLEEELGAPLVYRDGKDTRLTALGRELQVEFMRIDGLVGNVYHVAENSVAGHRRLLLVGIASTISPGAFVRFFGHVVDQLPSVELHLHPMLPGESEDEVLTGKYSLCILPSSPLPNAKLETVSLFSERLMLAVAARHRLAAHDLVTTAEMASEPYIDRINCEFRSQLVMHFMDRNIVMRPRIQSEREDWVQQLVAEGVGVCALPERSAVVPGIALRPVEGLDLARQVTLAAVSGSGNPREVRQILELARAFDWRM